MNYTVDNLRLVSDEMLQNVYEQMLKTNPYFRPPTWEQRLAWAIESRSIRGRVRRARYLWADRLSTAWDVLRGRHECDY